MSFEIVMPNLGFDTQTGRLIEWVKQPGETVQKGDILAIVESDKANVELESVAAGVMLEQLVPADTEVAVGAVIARVGKADEAKSGVGSGAGAQAASAASPQAASTAGSAGSTNGSANLVEVSPVAKRMAQEHGIDLARVSGSGPGGRITRGDVEAHVAGQGQATTSAANGQILALPKVRRLAREQGIELARVAASGSKGQVTLRDLQAHTEQLSAVATVETQRVAAVTEEADETVSAPAGTSVEGRREISVSRARRVIGERLGKSKRDAPHFYVSGEFDLQAALARLATMPAPQPRVNDLIQYLTVQALQRVRELNATYEGEKVYQYDYVHLGIAVALDDGLITPVLRNAENYSLIGLAKESKALIKRTREGHLKADDLQGATFTISNLGVIQQVERFTAVINPPQVGILAVGSVKPRAVVAGDGIAIRQTVYITLSGDHRVVDGMHLGRFMAAFGEQLDLFAQGG